MAITRVLVVDDEPAIAQMVGAILKQRGFEVVLAASGRSALDIIRRDRGIHLVVSDVVMPQMRGPDLVREIHRLAPSIKAVLMSGWVSESELSPAVSLLRKPFTPAALLAAIERALAPERKDVDRVVQVRGPQQNLGFRCAPSRADRLNEPRQRAR